MENTGSKYGNKGLCHRSKGPFHQTEIFRMRTKQPGSHREYKK